MLYTNLAVTCIVILGVIFLLLESTQEMRPTLYQVPESTNVTPVASPRREHDTPVSDTIIFHSNINGNTTTTSTVIRSTTDTRDTAAVITATATETPERTEPEPLPPLRDTHGIAWGVFTGSNKGALDEFEKRVDANPDYLAWFVHWGNHGGELPAYVREYSYEKDRTLVLFWEASDYIIGGTDQPAYAYSRILAGDWDAYIEDFKKQLIDYEGEVILIPFSELNGDWTPWSGTENGNTPELAIEAFRYLHDHMSDAPNISFGWAVNRMSVPNTYENRIERYYPGDQYVDYIGVDGFNKGNPWLTFSEIFHEPLMTLAQYNKPTFVFSFGSAPGPQKAEWLETAFYEDMPKYPHLVGWVYFNQDKERNWLLWSDPASFQVFADYIEE